MMYCLEWVLYRVSKKLGCQNFWPVEGNLVRDTWGASWNGWVVLFIPRWKKKWPKIHFLGLHWGTPEGDTMNYHKFRIEGVRAAARILKFTSRDVHIEVPTARIKSYHRAHMTKMALFDMLWETPWRPKITDQVFPRRPTLPVHHSLWKQDFPMQCFPHRDTLQNEW